MCSLIGWCHSNSSFVFLRDKWIKVLHNMSRSSMKCAWRSLVKQASRLSMLNNELQKERSGELYHELLYKQKFRLCHYDRRTVVSSEHKGSWLGVKKGKYIINLQRVEYCSQAYNTFLINLLSQRRYEILYTLYILEIVEL